MNLETFLALPKTQRTALQREVFGNKTPANQDWDNKERATLAESILRNYAKGRGELFDGSVLEVVDLIADLLHFAAARGNGANVIDAILKTARMHFDAEHYGEDGL